MDAQLVYRRFLTLAGTPEPEGAAWLSLCEEAAQDLQRRLRPGADSNSPRLVYPAAAMAVVRMLLSLSAAEDTTSFAAGDIRATRDMAPALLAARQQQQEALRQIADLLEDDGFFFAAVGGAV